MKNKKTAEGNQHEGTHQGGAGAGKNEQQQAVPEGSRTEGPTIQGPEKRSGEAEILKEVEQQLNDEKDKYVRLYAEFDNYRKRMIKERDDISRRCNEELVTALLPTMDNLETAFKHAQDASEALLQGVEMTMREFRRTLEKFGLKPVDALGQPFNPEFHHAIAQEDRDDVPDKTVVEELRSGYIFNDRVIRASMVVVSKRQDIPKEDL